MDISVNKRCCLYFALLVLSMASIFGSPSPALAADSVTIWRLYNQGSGEHLFTKDANEYRVLATKGWKQEGRGWDAPVSSATPVYRLLNPNSGDHHYTTDKNEYNTLGRSGWKQENVAFYSAESSAKPIYRLFNPNVEVGTHHYTTSITEYAACGSNGWREERVGWYGLGSPDSLPNDWTTVSGTLIKTTYGKRAQELINSGKLGRGDSWRTENSSSLNYLKIDPPIKINARYQAVGGGEGYGTFEADSLILSNVDNYSSGTSIRIAVNQRKNTFFRGTIQVFGIDAGEVAIL